MTRAVNKPEVSLCAPVEILKSGIPQAIGEEMYDEHKAGAEIPKICDEGDGIRPDLMTLINQMTSFNRSDRPTALSVHEQLLEVS